MTEPKAPQQQAKLFTKIAHDFFAAVAKHFDAKSSQPIDMAPIIAALPDMKLCDGYKVYAFRPGYAPENWRLVLLSWDEEKCRELEIAKNAGKGQPHHYYDALFDETDKCLGLIESDDIFQGLEFSPTESGFWQRFLLTIGWTSVMAASGKNRYKFVFSKAEAMKVSAAILIKKGELARDDSRWLRFETRFDRWREQMFWPSMKFVGGFAKIRFCKVDFAGTVSQETGYLRVGFGPAMLLESEIVLYPMLLECY